MRRVRRPLCDRHSEPNDHHHLVTVISSGNPDGARMTPDDDITKALIEALESLTASNRELQLLQPSVAGHLVKPFEKESTGTNPLQLGPDHDA